MKDMKQILRETLGLEAERWFSKLSEADANGYSEATANAILEHIRAAVSEGDGAFMKDPAIKDIMASKGDATAIKQFNSAVKCIDGLSSMAARGPYQSRLTELQELVEFLQTRKASFQAAFANDSFLLKNFYISLIITVYHSTAVIVYRGVDYLKTPRGDYEMRMKDFKAEDDVILTGLHSTVANIRTGKLDQFLKGQAKNESASVLTEDPVSLWIAGLSIMTIIWVVTHIRDIVYTFLSFKKSVSDWFEAYADFIEMHALAISKDRKEVARKQEAVAKKFRKAAEFFAVDAQLANRNTMVAVKKQDIEVAGSARTAQSATSNQLII